MARAAPMNFGLLLLKMSTGTPGAVDEFQRLLAAGDPSAVAIYRGHQEQALGPDPLAVGACEWPADLAEPGNVVDVPADAPLYGWRMWAVRGTHLVAPFLTAAWGLERKAPGVEWRPGLNKVSTAHCGAGAHPRGDCRCGIRAVQSRSVLDRFAEQMEERLGAPGAVAQVAVWGRVAAYAPDDDWQYTLRAQYARIVGPVEVAFENEQQREGLARRYGVEAILE